MRNQEASGQDAKRQSADEQTRPLAKSGVLGLTHGWWMPTPADAITLRVTRDGCCYRVQVNGTYSVGYLDRIRRENRRRSVNEATTTRTPTAPKRTAKSAWPVTPAAAAKPNQIRLLRAAPQVEMGAAAVAQRSRGSFTARCYPDPGQ